LDNKIVENLFEIKGAIERLARNTSTECKERRQLPSKERGKKLKIGATQLQGVPEVGETRRVALIL